MCRDLLKGAKIGISASQSIKSLQISFTINIDVIFYILKIVIEYH